MPKKCRDSVMRHIFTLVELLVVIAIIGILASLLLPALNKARGQAKKAACLGNIKQVGLGLLNYADDFNYWLPMTLIEWPTNGGGCWCWRAADYFGVKSATPADVLHCPGREFSGVTPSVDRASANYSMVAYVSKTAYEGPSDMYYGKQYTSTSGRFANRFVQSYMVAPPMQDFSNPANSFILYEFNRHETWKGLGTSVNTDMGDTSGIFGPLGKWHGQVGFMNGAFADGHAENVSMQSTYLSISYSTGHAYVRGKMFSITGKN